MTGSRPMTMRKKNNFDDIEERMAKLEGTVSQMNERLNDINDRFNDMNVRMNHLGDEITGLREKIDSNFKWLLLILLGSWITTIGTFVGFFLIILNK